MFTVKSPRGSTFPVANVEEAFLLAHRIGVGASYWLGGTLLGRIVRYVQPREVRA